MRRSGLIIVLASFVLLGIGVVATWPGPKEPEYNGKTLSQWLLYKPTASEATNAFELQSEAIRQIGEAAVPWLLKWVRYRTPAWRRKLERFLGGDPRIERVNAVWLAFRILGPKAAAAIPELTRMINSPKDQFYGKPLLALAAMGERGFPPVLAVLETSNHLNRATAARLIGETADWGTNRLLAVPALVSCLHDEKEFFLVAAAESSLATIAKDKNVPLPALADKLATPATNHLDDTVDSLTKLVVSQKTPERLRLAATTALGSLGPRANEAVPALVRTLNDDNQVIQSAATNALRKIKDF